jgi:hypothetical protein
MTTTPMANFTCCFGIMRTFRTPLEPLDFILVIF